MLAIRHFEVFDAIPFLLEHRMQATGGIQERRSDATKSATSFERSNIDEEADVHLWRFSELPREPLERLNATYAAPRAPALVPARIVRSGACVTT